MTDHPLSERLWSAPLPSRPDAEDRAVRACRAQALEHAAAGPQLTPRRWTRRRPFRIVALAGAGALALVAAVAVLRGADTTSEGSSFSSFAAIAAAQPAGEFQHVEWEARWRHSWPPHYVQSQKAPKVVEQEDRVALWISDDLRYERGTHNEGRGKSNLVEYLVDRESDLTCLPNSMRLPITVVYESGERLSYEGGDKGVTCSSGSIFGTSVWADPGLPTEPQALRKALADGLHAPVGAITESELRQAPPPESPPETEPLGSVPVPLSQTIEGDREMLPTELGLGTYDTRELPRSQRLFARALTHLRNPRSSPELRAALFEVLGDLEGVTLTTDQTDSLGRDAAVATYDAPPTDVNKGAQIQERLYLDPENSHVLEVTTTVESGAGTPPDERVWGTFVETFTLRETVDSLPPKADPLVDELARTPADG